MRLAARVPNRDFLLISIEIEGSRDRSREEEASKVRGDYALAGPTIDSLTAPQAALESANATIAALRGEVATLAPTSSASEQRVAELEERVEGLREALHERSLDTSGDKPLLQQRLMAPRQACTSRCLSQRKVQLNRLLLLCRSSPQPAPPQTSRPFALW